MCCFYKLSLSNTIMLEPEPYSKIPCSMNQMPKAVLSDECDNIAQDMHVFGEGRRDVSDVLLIRESIS